MFSVLSNLNEFPHLNKGSLPDAANKSAIPYFFSLCISEDGSLGDSEKKDPGNKVDKDLTKHQKWVFKQGAPLDLSIAKQ